jgi:hypothetical protein
MEWKETIPYILILNGIYDIICVCSILFQNQIPELQFFADLHPKMFKEKSDLPVLQRILAYWIFTYGIVRLYAGFYPECYSIAAYTYFIEAFCIFYEYKEGKTIDFYTSIFVSIFSLGIGLWILYFVY